MQTRKNSFVVYNSWYDVLSAMSDEELGVLLRAMFKYNRDEAIPDLPDNLRIAFSFISSTFDYDREKYKKRCEKNRENIRLRWKKEASDAGSDD